MPRVRVIKGEMLGTSLLSSFLSLSRSNVGLVTDLDSELGGRKPQ